MVEIQSCANLVKDSSLCSIEQEVKEDNVNVNVVIAEISGELKRERQKNAELMEKISVLEAQIQEREKGILLSNGQGSCPDTKERCLKKFKRQKTEPISEKIEDVNLENRLVNWMSMDDTQNFHSEKFKESDAFCETDESDDEDDECFDENENEIDHKDKENCDNVQAPNELKELLVGLDEEINASCLEGGPAILVERSNEDIKKDSLPPYTNLRQCGSISMQKKPPKMAFCPKEIKKIIELEELLLKNAQSHTIRKILVFASLGIRHGLEDMYELDFNHFSILQQGEQYVSPKNPGEHVLYESPGVRRKVFYPNRQNPTLCPVQILEEEKTMRPLDASCPSCLFLCIKYGGRTRNLPQNEYVRQRMGRNKLKSFGPVICRMAMLFHIRSGSFFFKALGITLLFMAGFSDDLVQKETKYRNLDLLQKYYRTDEDAEGEELFLLHPLPCVTVSLKTVSTKSKGKKHNSSTTKPHNSQTPSITHTPPSRPAPPTQFGLMGYNSIQTHAMSAFQSMPPPTPVDPTPLSNRPVTHPGPTIPFRNQYPYPIFPPNPTNNFVPMMYWPPPNAFYPSPYPSSYDYRYFPSAGNYVSVLPHPYYRNTSGNLLIPEMVEASAETADDSNSSSRTTGPKEDE